jgi:HD domain
MAKKAHSALPRGMPSPALAEPFFSPEQQSHFKRVFDDRFRRPLFVIGSGVSLQSGAPGMPSVFRHLQRSLQKARETKIADDHREVVEETARIAAAIASGVAHRPLAARLFGELQDSRVPILREVWDTFCSSFLEGELSVDLDPPVKTKPIGDLEPTKTHRILARFYEQINALALSFNFDGLTHQALQQHFVDRSDDQVYILDDPSKIQEFYGRESGGPRSWAVWKIRGDVFFAICQTSGCPSKDRPTPVYELRRRLRARKDQPTGSASLACTECGLQRSLRISFPGLEQKERETAAIIDQMWRYVVPTISGIFILGLSGVWDEGAISSLFSAARAAAVPVFDVKPAHSDVDPDNSHIEDIRNRDFATVTFSRVIARSDEFMAALDEWRTLNPPPTACVLDPLLSNSFPFPADRLWAQESHFSLHRPDSTDIAVPASSNSIAYELANHPDVITLNRYSQLGLKNYWWGRKRFANHNRYLHSIGTARVAACWHSSLSGSISKSFFPTRSQDYLERENAFLIVSALLHDVGHLPFSHLFEEIFADLHWSMHVGQGTFSHVQNGAEKIKMLLEQGSFLKPGNPRHAHIPAAMSDLGYSAADVVALTGGHTGVGYLDAIVNSPIDADKIDYIFRDSGELNLGVRLMDKETWLAEFLSSQDITQEGLVRLNGRSAVRLLELLETRRALYADFYLAPWVRAMEAIAALIITKFILVFTSDRMLTMLQSGDVQFPSPRPDWGPLKIALVTEKVEEIYRQTLQDIQKSHSSNPVLEYPLLLHMLKTLREDPLGAAIDQQYRNEFLGRIEELLHAFDADDSDPNGTGTQLRKFYQRVHLAGPFRVRRTELERLREIARHIQLTYPDKVLISIWKTPRFLSTSDGRVYSASGRRPTGENILVPSKKPGAWTMKSDARVPLHQCDFSDFESDWVQVLLIDPWCGASLSGRYVLDVFRRLCRDSDVNLRDDISEV